MAVGPASALGFFRLLLVILTMGKHDPQFKNRVESAMFPTEAAIYAHMDVNALRQMCATDKEFAKALLGAEKHEAAYQNALKAISAQAKANPEDIELMVSRIRAFGMWWLALTDDDDTQRLLFVADCAETQGIPDALARLFGQRFQISSSTYLNHPYHVIVRGRHPLVFLGEMNGFLAIGTDPLSVKTFMLEQQKKEAVAKDKRPMGCILHAHATGQRFFNSVLSMVRRHDMDEFAAVSGLFDFASYERLDANLTSKGLTAKLQLRKGTPADSLLKAGKSSPIFQILPKEGVGIAAALSDVPKVYAHIKQQLAAIFPGRRNPIARVEQGWQRELGLDFEKNFINNLKAAGYIIFSFEKERDLENGLVVLEPKDMKAAQKSFDRFVDFMAGKRNGINVEKTQNGKYVEMRRMKMGINDRFVVFGGGRGLQAKDVTDFLAQKPKKAEAVESLLASGRFNISPLIRRKFAPVEASLTRNGQSIDLASDLKVKDLVGLFGNTATGGLFARQYRIENANDLKQIGLGMLMYSGENEGKFPPDMRTLQKDQILNAGPVYIWRNPGTGQADGQYIYFPGFRDDDAKATTRMLAAAPKPYDGRRNVLFIDGHVELLMESVFQRRLREQKSTLTIQVDKKSIPEKDQAEIRKLCKQLGSTSFKERSAARKKLKSIGKRAFPILQEFANDTDPEIRTAVKKLMEGLAVQPAAVPTPMPVQRRR